MLQSTLLILATSYVAWHLERFETAVVYPFDTEYATPVHAGEPRLTERRFETVDGEDLILWTSDATPGQPTILYLPGNAGGLKDRTARFAQLIDKGYGVTALAYRGSSGSTGSPDETVLTEDAIAVAMSEMGSPLILYGESLGTAVAIKLAVQGLGDAVILEAPFTSLADLVSSQYPSEDLDHLITQRWDSLGGAPAVRQPLLVLHGSNDNVVPVHMGREIFESAGSRDKQFVEITGGNHNDLWTEDTLAVLFGFLSAR